MSDVIVIGGGMAGVSAAFFLAEHASVLLLEREDRPGYHSTGRSAALYSQAYGNAAVRAVTVASHGFFTEPPARFAGHPLLTPRGAMFIGAADRADAVAAHAEAVRALVPGIRMLDAAETCGIVPALRPDMVACGVLEPDAMDIDVDALHQGFLRGLAARGGRVVTEAEVTGLDRGSAGWQVTTTAGRFEAPIVVNAAGAWADVIGQMAGCRSIGLVPKRRTAVLLEPPSHYEVRTWPLTVEIDETFYFKPDAGALMLSPADETPSEPTDAQPEELDVAIAVDRLETWTDIKVRRITHRWAGLRSFVADKSLVAGFDPEQEGFFWLAGQGGYGIQTAPAMGRITAALARGGTLPSDVAGLGLTEADLSPARLRPAAHD